MQGPRVTWSTAQRTRNSPLAHRAVRAGAQLRDRSLRAAAPGDESDAAAEVERVLTHGTRDARQPRVRAPCATKPSAASARTAPPYAGEHAWASPRRTRRPR